MRPYRRIIKLDWTSPMRMEITNQLTSPLQDPNWKEKLGLLSLSGLFFFTAPAVAGYQMELIRESAQGKTKELPSIGANFAALWTRGLLLFIVISLLMIVPLLGVGGLLFSMTFLFTGHAAMLVGWLLLAILLFCTLTLAVAIPMPALILNYVVDEDLSCLWNMSRALTTMKKSLPDYAVIAALPVVTAILSGIVVSTGIGAILTVPLFTFCWVVQGRMLGQYHRAFCH